MAYQPKSYRKFVASAATATLVATAVTPAFAAEFTDVNKNYKDAVDYLVKNDIAKGKTETTFGTALSITRGDAAYMIAKALKLDTDNAPKSSFTDLNSRVKGSVNALFAAGIISGKTETTFKPDANITRAEMAKIIANAYKLKAGDTKNEFTDVNSNWDQYVDALLANKITFGKTETTFAPNANVTRGEFALFMYRAKDIVATPAVEEVKAVNDTTIEVTFDGKLTADQVKELEFTFDPALKVEKVELKATASTKAAAVEKTTVVLTTEKQKEGTTYKLTAVKGAELKAPVTVTPAPIVNPVVESVSTINSTTIKLTGTGLTNLKAEDITVNNNTVSYVNTAIDGKSAEVILGAALVPDTEYTVSIKGKEATKDFKVTYKLVANTATVDAKSYDDDTANQYVSFQINGAVGKVNDLLVNGYSVSFAAVDKDGADATSTVFANTTTGELKTNLTAGSTYKVQLTVSKGSDVIVSPQTEISIKNFELIASTIDSYELTNADTDVFQKSNTLVAGETVDLTEIKATQNSSSTKLNATAIQTAITNGTMKVTSSNSAVVSVDDAELSANTPGTATITITYGNATKTFTLTVAQKARELTKVVPAKTSVPVILGNSTATVDLTAVDQYGDYMNSESITATSSDTSIVTVTNPAATAGEGETTLTIGAVKVGTASVTFKNSDGVTVGSLSAKVTDVGGVDPSKTKLEIKAPTAAEEAAGQSKDATIDLYTPNTDDHVIYRLQQYTAENVKNGLEDLAGYRVVYNKDIVTIDGLDGATGNDEVNAAVAPATTVNELKISAKKAGYSDVAVYNTDGKLVSQVRVTVVNNTPQISAVSFKSVPEVTYSGKVIDFKSILDTVESSGDDIVKGITLTKSTGSPIRIDDSTPSGELYIDVNGNGAYDSGDTLLGELQLTVASGATGLTNFNNATTDAVEAIEGGTTVAGDKGTLIFKVVNTKTPAEIVASTSISVNVPK